MTGVQTCALPIWFIARNFYHANPPTDPDAFNKLKNTLSDETIFPQNLAYFLSVRPENLHLGLRPGAPRIFDVADHDRETFQGSSRTGGFVEGAQALRQVFGGRVAEQEFVLLLVSE